MQLRKATRQKAKLKIGLAGPSGAGKTYSALLLASGMTTWDKIAVIDTENGSGDLYAHLGAYNTLTLQAPFSPERYIEAIKTCEEAGMEVIIIDSITHEWSGKGGCLELHGSMSGNSFTNWAKITPRHTAFIDAILQSKCHIITTVRKKQDYDMSKDSNGKTEVTKVGLAEIQREGYSYEVTLNFDVSIDHYVKADKDRTGLFMDQPGFKITPDTGKILIKWAESGSDPIEYKPDPKNIEPDIKRDLRARLKELGATDDKKGAEIINGYLGTKFKDVNWLTDQQAKASLDKLNDLPF